MSRKQAPNYLISARDIGIIQNALEEKAQGDRSAAKSLRANSNVQADNLAAVLEAQADHAEKLAEELENPS